MGKTIEVLSANPGKISFLIEGEDENRIVDFKPCGEGGIAMCDEKEAEHLIGKIGPPAFRKPGAIEVSGQVVAEPEKTEPEKTEPEKTEPAEPEKPKADTFELSADTYATLKNANELKAVLPQCDDVGVLKQLISIETNRDSTRNTWMEPLQSRLDELQKS